MRVLIATVAAVLLLGAVAFAFASGTSPLPVIAYINWHTGADKLYVTGPGGMHEVGNGQDPSVAPDGLLVSGSSYADSRRALTIYETAGDARTRSSTTAVLSPRWPGRLTPGIWRCCWGRTRPPVCH
ncbi:MAG: hypothetical protein ACLP8S_18435 [Solirubrobacteraceae bacterium]